MAGDGGWAPEQWVLDALAFFESSVPALPGEARATVRMAPPWSVGQVDALAAELARPMPSSVRQFLAHGASGVSFSYEWTPPEAVSVGLQAVLPELDQVSGHGELCVADDCAALIEQCRGWAEETWIAEFPEDLAFWSQSFPIMAIGNGDMLAIDQRESPDGTAVVYLSHDDESRVIAPDLATFLSVWAQLGYVGPEIWVIEPFLDDDGRLSAETEGALALRRAFGGSA